MISVKDSDSASGVVGLSFFSLIQYIFYSQNERILPDPSIFVKFLTRTLPPTSEGSKAIFRSLCISSALLLFFPQFSSAILKVSLIRTFHEIMMT